MGINKNVARHLDVILSFIRFQNYFLKFKNRTKNNEN